MPIRFKAQEIFKIAIRSEENASQFYRQAATIFKDSSQSKVFLTLAEMEDTHQKTFTKLANEFIDNGSEQPVYDPFNEAELYLQALGDYQGGEGSIKFVTITANQRLLDVIDLAIELEKKSILFYVGLKGFVPDDLGKEKIDFIIEEEKKHLMQLAQLRFKNA